MTHCVIRFILLINRKMLKMVMLVARAKIISFVTLIDLYLFRKQPIHIHQRVSDLLQGECKYTLIPLAPFIILKFFLIFFRATTRCISNLNNNHAIWITGY